MITFTLIANGNESCIEERVNMNKFLQVMDDIIIAILGKSVVEKRSGEDRRKKKPRKRKYEKRIAGKSSDRRN